ncbi:hypothetical protein FQR65_LT14559 [Abscondita terminalis]|nr:hypothetical protein FQR65_LT14559 [Abscondita terminalis]
MSLCLQNLARATIIFVTKEKEKSFRLKDDMVKEAASTSTDIKSIFVQKSSSASRDVASKVAFPAVAKCMRRVRRQVQPPMPDTLQQLGEFCQHSPRYGLVDNEVFCRGASGTGNQISVIFLAEGLTQLLKETREVHIDGTFKTRPRHPASSQLLTIMAVQYGYVNIMLCTKLVVIYKDRGIRPTIRQS